MTRKPAGDRKSEIVAAVLGLADRLGPDRLTMQAVADAVGLTQPGVFRHFPSRQALWQAVGEAIAQSMEAAWSAALADPAADPGAVPRADPRAPEQRLEALIRVQLRHIEATPAIPAILHSRELQAQNAPLRASFRALMTRFQGLLHAELAAARASGRFRPDLPPEDGALLLMSLVQGLAIRWSLGNRGFPLEAEGARLIGAQVRLMRADPPAAGGAA
jgi:AcrR family transcriptional regulator